MKEKGTPINTDLKCEYGCNQNAQYLFKNGKYCCSDEWFRCPKKKKERSNQRKIEWKNFSETFKKDRNKNISKKIKKAWEDPETREKWVRSMQGNNSLSIRILTDRYPKFINIEKVREINNNIECKCKECNKWFQPTYIQLYERIRQIENEDGNGCSYLFCSSTCKYISEYYYKNHRGDPLKQTEFKNYLRKVYRYTYQTCKKYNIKEFELRGRNSGYELDHIYSIFDGFSNNVDPKVISHRKNLRIIPTEINRQKGSRSDISLKELYERISVK